MTCMRAEFVMTDSEKKLTVYGEFWETFGSDDISLYPVHEKNKFTNSIEIALFQLFIIFIRILELLIGI